MLHIHVKWFYKFIQINTCIICDTFDINAFIRFYMATVRRLARYFTSGPVNETNSTLGHSLRHSASLKICL